MRKLQIGRKMINETYLSNLSYRYQTCRNDYGSGGGVVVGVVVTNRSSWALATTKTTTTNTGVLAVADPNIPFRGWGEMRLNAKGTVGSFGGRKLI